MAVVQAIAEAGAFGPWSRMQLFVGTASAEGARTNLHFDQYDNLFVQLSGVKTFLLFPPSQSGNLYPYPVHHSLDRSAQAAVLRGGSICCYAHCHACGHAYCHTYCSTHCHTYCYAYCYAYCYTCCDAGRDTYCEVYRSTHCRAQVDMLRSDTARFPRSDHRQLRGTSVTLRAGAPHLST